MSASQPSDRKRKRERTEDDSERKAKRKAFKAQQRLVRGSDEAATGQAAAGLAELVTEPAGEAVTVERREGKRGEGRRDGMKDGDRAWTKNAARRKRKNEARAARKEAEESSSKPVNGTGSAGLGQAEEQDQAPEGGGDPSRTTGDALVSQADKHVGRGPRRKSRKEGKAQDLPEAAPQDLANGSDQHETKSERKGKIRNSSADSAARTAPADRVEAKSDRNAQKQALSRSALPARDGPPVARGDKKTKSSRRQRKEERRRKRTSLEVTNDEDDLFLGPDHVAEPDTRVSSSKDQMMKDAKGEKIARRAQRKQVRVQERKRQAQVDASWTVSEPAGGRYLDAAPLFARDEQHLLFATEYAMSSYSTATSTMDRSLPAESSDHITAYTVAPSDDKLAYVGTKKGYVTSWDWAEGKSIGRWHIGAQIHNIAATRLAGSDHDIVFTIDKAINWTITAHHFDSNGDPQKTKSKILSICQKPLRSLHVLNQGKFIATITSNGLLLGKLIKSEKGRFKDLEYIWQEVPCRQAPTCFDMRPSVRQPGDSYEDIDVVYGGIGGAIYFYRNMFDMLDQIDNPKEQGNKGRAPTAVPLNWHRESVGAVAFSRDGKYIISGGRETVLVLWQLDTGKKQFLPHLESPIQSLTISPSGALYAVGLGDNSVMVLSTAELTPTANFAGLQCPATSMSPSQQQILPTQEVFDQLVTGDAALSIRALVHTTRADNLLCAVPSHQSAQASLVPSNPPSPYLQTFLIGSEAKSTYHMSRQALTRTHATDTNTGPELNRLLEPNITHMSMSHNGHWLATVDEWTPPPQDLEDLILDVVDTPTEMSKHREVTLRIWQWQESTDAARSDGWGLNSRIDSPHLLDGSRVSGRVLALAAQPESATFATVGEDCIVRIWAPKTRLQNGRVFWSDINELEVKGKKVSKEVNKTWWAVLHTIALPSAMEEESLNRRTPARAALAYSNDSSLLVAHFHFDLMSDALDMSRVVDIDLDEAVDDNQGSLVHFIDIDAGSIRESRESMCPTSSQNQDMTTAVLSDGIHAMGFLERHLVILNRLSAFVWDVTDFSLVLQIPLPSLRHKPNERPVDTAFPPAPHLAINLPTNTFAISAPVRRSNDELQQGFDAKLPPHPHREYTSRLLVYGIPSQPKSSDTNEVAVANSSLNNREPLLVGKLPRLTLALLSLAGAADGDVNTSHDRLALSTTETDGGQDIANGALKRGYVTVDVTATLRTIRPPLYSSSAAAIINGGREESSPTVSAAEKNQGALAALALGRDVDDEDVSEAEDVGLEAQTNGIVMPSINGTGGRHTPAAPRLVSEQKLAEVLEYGGSAESMARDEKGTGSVVRAGVLPSVREMFEGVLDLFVGKRGSRQEA